MVCSSKYPRHGIMASGQLMYVSPAKSAEGSSGILRCQPESLQYMYVSLAQEEGGVLPQIYADRVTQKSPKWLVSNVVSICLLPSFMQLNRDSICMKLYDIVCVPGQGRGWGAPPNIRGSGYTKENKANGARSKTSYFQDFNSFEEFDFYN